MLYEIISQDGPLSQTDKIRRLVLKQEPKNGPETQFLYFDHFS